VVFNTYLVFSINAMSISDSCESCTSSHCPCTVRTCGARRRRVVRAYSSCVIIVLSRVVRACRACDSHASSHVVCVCRVCHLLMSLTLPRIVRTLSRAVSRASSRVVRECRACCSHALSRTFRVCRASRHALLTRISCVDRVGRATSAHDNK
jgi:hypothetical protein